MRRACLILVSRLYSILSFFFSSRRRHTRWPRDWSSDVCSSDLFPANDCAPHPVGPAEDPRGGAGIARGEQLSHPGRSEERRVGKERRAPWAPSSTKIQTKK